MDEDVYQVVMERFHFINLEKGLDLSHEEVERNGKPFQIATLASNVLEEYFRAHSLIELEGFSRIVIHE
ncbi:MAG: hypothetical protein IJ088_09330 [Clostridia bacterium]|nr:hypothetical protein [Clostridia bacterium]